MRYLVLKDSDNISEIIAYLLENLGIPKIQRRMNIYSEEENFQLEFLDNKVFWGNLSNRKKIFLKNKNLKFFLKYIQSRNEKGFIINDIELLNFDRAKILFNTFHGHIISIEDDVLFNKTMKKFNLKSYEDIKEHKPLFMSEKENLFDEIGNLNSKIKKYANQTGIDIRSTSSSLRLRLSNVSNDYSHIEKYYKQIVNDDLLSFDSKTDYINNFDYISIIIPVYNQCVIPTLLSIQGQNIPKEQKRKIQVIIVNDGSSNNVLDDVNLVKSKLDYEINLISFEQNMGLSNARNTGLSIAKHNLLLFLDSDIILSENYIYDINIRLQIVPNAIFVAMRKNVEKDSELIKEEKLLKGIKRTLDFDDSRVVTQSKEYHIGWDKAFEGEIISILDDTNYFKELSFGSKLGIYDLSSVVTGHNIAINRSQISNYPAFSTRFKGWGMEDSYFASKLISNGCFVIPVLSSCVFHINHPPRSGNMDKKVKEAKENFETYNLMLDEKWEE